MKLKQFIFALVAMLSFSFSAFAQTTVSSQVDLETALQNGGEVTLGASITVSAPVTIPSSSEVVLNLNGKTLKATNAKTKVLENNGKLTINGQGTVSGIIYNGKADDSAAEMTLNGGTYSLDGNNGGLHHYGKTLTINDGVVVKTTSYGVRMAGKKSVLNLYGGTYTSTGTGDMARPFALSNGTVNFLDSDITVNGHMHVMVGQVTVNFGDNNQYSPFEAYHQGNSYASSVFYCKTLAEAISRTGFAAVTLVKNVKVADGAPITVNKKIDLDLNGKNLSATNAKTTVLKNYANLTIEGKGTVTGLVYNGDAENKGVAEMTLNGGTYKLDGANGGFFNFGKTLTVNDGVTISSQVYGLRMSNAASVINLNGGTFTSTNPTDNMKRAIAVDAGTINFNDDDITINGYLHANRTKAKVNFGEYCPFDAFMYSTTNASGYYVVNLENAIDKADAGYEIVLQKNLERSEIVTLPKKVTLDGNGKTLTSTAGRAINVDCADVVTIENLTIAGATGCERGINIINKAGTTNLKKVNVSGVSHYAVHVATSAGAAQVNIENSNLTGWAAVAAYGDGGTINVKNSNLVGINNYANNGSNSFSTIAVGSNVNVNVAGGYVKAVSQEGKDGQFVLGAQADVTGASITADAELITEGTAKYFGVDLDKNTVAVREVYGTNYVTTPAGNGLVTLTGASEAEVNGVKYAKFEAAIKAAKAGDIVTVFEGTYKVPSMKAGITIVGKGNVLFEGTLTGTLENLTMKNIHIKGGNAQRWAYAKGDLVFENVTFEATSVYALHFDGIAEGTNLTYKNCTIIGWAAMGGSPESCVFEGCTIKDNGTYGVIRTYFDAEIKDCTFDVANANTEDIYEDGIHAVDGAKVNVDNCTNGNGDMKDLVNISGASKVTVDGVVYENVAKVDDNYYATLAEAFAAVGDGAGKKVELIANVDLAGAEWTPVNFNGEFDGQNYTISNLVVNGAGKSNQGFFAQTQNGEIKNVTFHNAKVTGRLNVGVVAGTPYTSTYTNVKVTGHVEVNGMAYVGGVGGKNAYANWTDITVDVDGTSYVKATSTENGTAYRTYVGGVIGFNGEGGHTFKNISSNIKVIGDVMDIGGIFGILHYGNNAENITFTGAVEAPAEAKEVGGIAGVWHNEKGQVVTITNAKSEGPVTVGDVTTTGSLVGGAYNANNVTPSTSGSLKVDDKEMWFSVAKIGDTTYRTLAEALTAAKDGETVSLLWAEGEAPIAMNGAVFGKNVTIKGTATVDWSKGWLFVGRGGEGNATVTFDGANLTSASDNASYGIHVSGREKNTNNKYDGTLVIKNSTIELDFLINKGAMTLDNSSLTVKNGFAVGGRPAGETESGEDATATMNLTNKSKLVVNNHNGMGLGYEAIGVMNVDATSTFEATENFLVTAKGTVNVNGGNVIIAGELTNNGTVVVTGNGNSKLDVKNYSGNAIQLNNGNLVDTYFAGRVDAFGTNNISGTTTIGGILGLGYETNPTEQVVVNITGNFNGNNVLVRTNNSVDNILNVGKADGERTKVHFGQLGAFADVNVVNTDVTYGYAFIRNDFNATNSTFEIKGGVNTYFAGNAKVVLDKTTWNLSGYANIGSYGGYMYGNADVTLKNGSSMTATSLGVEVSGEKVVKLTLEDNSSLTATKLTNQGSIVLASVTASLNSNECANVTTSVPNQVVVYNNGAYTLVAAVAQIGGTAYTSLQAAINAVKDGETITLVDNVTGNITLTEKVDLHYTIDGAGKTMNGKIVITPLSDENDNRRITIKGINFVNTADAAVDFISCVVTNHYPRLTVEGCTFTGNGKNTDVALRLKTAYGAVIKDCTGTGLHSFLQNTAGKSLTIENVNVTESKGAFALGTVQGVTIKGSTIDVATYGIRLDANTYNNNAVIEGNEVTAFIPVVVRSVNTQSNVTFTGENTFTAENTHGKWMVIGTTEYEAGKELPAETTEGNVVVALNGNGLGYDGIHGAGLAGAGTADAPYLINNVAELEIFRNSVNAGSAKYNKDGLCVALGADIDMDGNDWSVNIGDDCNATFDGIFDGKNHTISNLTSTENVQKSDGYICTGLFGAIGGNAVVKNFTIKNVTINTGDFTGNNVAAVVGFAYNAKGSIENVKVTGNININAKNAVGVGAILGYDYYSPALVVKDCEVKGNDGSAIVGLSYVGGAVGYASNKIQLLGNSVENVSITANNAAAGGVAGIMNAGGSAADNAVKNVALASNHANWKNAVGVVAGTITTGKVTIANTTIENVNTDAVAGAIFADKPTTPVAKVEARIGDAYYTTFAAAYTAAQAGETVTLLTDLTMSEILVLDKAITLDGNGNKLTSTAGRAINVDCDGNVAIKNLTIDAKGERAINVIQKPANVTIEKVTAAAANYTVNVAASAGAAKVAITDSNLTGLNVVNVTASGAEVTINGGTITCNDQTDVECYAALNLTKEATNGKITADGVTFDIKGDSKKASNGAEGGVITIDGDTGEVDEIVAYISYGDTYYSFTTIEAAIAKANAGETVTLLRDVKASAIITIDKAITLDGNGKTLTSTAARAINVETEGNVTIENLTINAGERAINIINLPANVTVNNVTATAKNNAVMMATSAAGANLTVNNSDFTGLAVVNVASENSQVEINNTNITNVDANEAENYGAISIFKTASNATVVVNGGKVVVAGDSKAASIGAAGATVTFNGTEGNTEVQRIVAYIGDAGYTTLEEAIEDAKAGDVITLISDVTISYGARDLLATAAADKAVTIDGNGNTLTLNQTNSDWSSIGLENNNKLVLKNMIINKAGKGATSGAWNTHAIIFSTAVEMENVTVNNSVAVAADAAFTDVVFNEANGYYSLWIEANGQTVTVKGGSMTATNGGRGIKIADQYIDAPAKVTLSVDGTVFSTAKKAAVLVSSKAGAEITAANVNIANVAEDNVNFVWVDGDWATYFGNVTVNGAPAVMEDAASFVAAVTVNGAVKAYYATIAKAIEAVQAGEEVALVADVTASEVILLGKSVTINGNGHKVTSNATRVFRVTVANTEVTLNDVNMVNTAVRVGTNDIRGISVDDVTGVELTLNDCSVDFTDASANDWTYAVNVVGGSGHVINVNGGTYEGANVINVRGANQTVTVKDAVLTSLYPASDMYYGACIYVVQNNESSVVATGNTFNGDNAYAFNVGYTPVDESENVDNSKVYVAKVGTVYYHSVNEAINAAADGATVQLLNRTIDEAIAPWTGDSQHRGEKSITIQGYADFGTRLTGGMFLGYNDGTVRENTITVKGINFVGKGVVVANQKNVVVEGNKFTGINALVSDKHANSNCAILVIGTSKDMSIAATVKNNVIEKVANAGIYLSQVGAVVVEGNTVTGTKHNALTVSAATTATVDVKNNTFAQWGLGGEGRAMRISGAATVNVNENVMSYEGTMPEEFVKVTGAAAFNASANYWNGESLMTEGLLAGVDPLTVARSYYTDAEKQNLVELTATKSVAKVGKTYYVTFAEAFNVAAQTGNEVTILAGEHTGGLTIDKAITVKGEADADGNNLVAFTGTLSIKANGATVKNLNFTNTSGKAASINAKDVLIEGCSLIGSNGLYQSYTSGLVTFKDSYIKGGTYGIHFDGKAGGEIVIDNCTVIGWTSFAKAIKKVTITGTKFAEGNYNFVRLYQEDITIEGCTFNEKMMVDLSVDGATATVNDCTVEGNRTVESLFYGADIVNSDITVDGELLVRVAKIGDVYYETLAEAVKAAVTGNVVTIVADVETSAAGYATVGEENYAVIVAVKEKEITLDLNGKSITVNPTAEELANAEGKMLMSVFGMDTNGKLTLKGNGSVKVNANGANVYSLVAAYGEGSAVVIENGNYEADAVMASGSLIYSHEMITVKGGTFKLGNLASGANGSPWIFNTIGQNYTGVTVEGGTYPTDINHQFWANEVLVPEAYALKNNGDGTWTVVDAVAYTNEKATSRNASWRHVGYASLEDAIAATGKYNCENNTVTMIKDITLEPITVANGVEVVLDLNGKTISGTDNNTSGNFYLIDNRGDLTITDSSEKAEGKITLEANNERNTSSSSVVVANNPGGKLAVWDGTIEHLGGTYMAYGIDNLTNGNLGDVNCTIDGGTIKSTYRAVRQFLNSDSKENNLVINGGTIEGVNKSIFFHDPSTKANNGTLYVGEEAMLNGDVYLFVTAGSTEWPVEVEIAVAALKGESTVTSKNVPSTYHVTKYPTAWIVECSELDELTIDEADYAETGYINLVEKKVKELTYVREFENTGWQSLYLPFGFTITEEMAAEFEFAYIYNASYKDKETVIDFVPVGAGFELAANYPYMIRAKVAGEKVIVVENAVLEVTKNETIDCSSVFEKFTFAGNYAANFAPEASAKKKFFALDGGWSKFDTLNPFRFYLQIELRNGSDFPADAANIRMRSVDQNGNATTGVESVGAEQGNDFIFDLHGRRVVEPQKGSIYIVNGKKVMF